MVQAWMIFSKISKDNIFKLGVITEPLVDVEPKELDEDRLIHRRKTIDCVHAMCENKCFFEHL